MATTGTAETTRLGVATRSIHLALVLLCLAGWASGDFAGDYKKAAHTGYDVHSWLGMGFALAILMRIAYGILGPAPDRFSAWVPFTRPRLRLAREDVLQLCRLQLPSRPAHEGLAGLVQAIGLLAFLMIATTGALLFVLLEPGARAAGLVWLLKEVHEIAESIIPAYLFLHVGAVVMHALSGDQTWRQMFFLRAPAAHGKSKKA